MSNSLRLGLLISALTLVNGLFPLQSLAQDQGGGTPGQLPEAAGGQNGSNTPDIVSARLHRQHARINHALKMGTITPEQAKQLKDAVDAIGAQVDQLRQANGGRLKPEDFKQIENSLNQTNAQIITVAESGDKTVQSGKVLGAEWTKGPDGAQNPNSLKREMKEENRRELRQERQNTEQKIEQQQLRYEREMIERLGEQRENILKQKDELKDVRKESGAD